MPTRLILLIAAFLTAGCGGPLRPEQRLVGAWVGRPETAAERVLRDWPTGDASDESAEAAAAEPPTDLERWSDVRVAMRLGPAGEAELSLDGGRTRRGEWQAIASEGLRLQLELALAAEGADDGPRELRRFDAQMLPPVEGEPPRFVLREMDAEPRFGRLLFERAGE